MVSLAGLALIIWGYGQYRAHDLIQHWSPPAFMRHITVGLMLFAVIFRRRCFRSKPHQDAAQASDAGRREDLGLGASACRMATSARSCCSVRFWLGVFMPASPPNAGDRCRTDSRRRPAGRMTCIVVVLGAAVYPCARASAFHPLRDRRTGVREVVHVGSRRDQAAHRAGHSRTQRRRADCVPDLLSRAHRPPRRRVLRRDSGGRLARHGDARARDDGSGHARHDDPARSCSDARFEAGAGGRRHAVRLLRRVRKSRRS